MDNINKFKINGVVTSCAEQRLTTQQGHDFTLTKITLEQQEDDGRYIKRNVFEIQIDFNKYNIMKGDTVEIEGAVYKVGHLGHLVQHITRGQSHRDE